MAVLDGTARALELVEAAALLSATYWMASAKQWLLRMKMVMRTKYN